MKPLIIALFVLGVPIVLSAQQPESDSSGKKSGTSLEVLGGYSIALGKYTSTDVKDDKAGYASGGWLTQLTFNLTGTRGLGIALQYSFQKNHYQDTANTIIPDGTRHTLGQAGWSNHYILAGLVYLGSFNKVLVDVKFLGGLVVSSSSVFNLTDPVSGENIKGYGSGFGMAFSAGAGYSITKHLALKINVGVLGGWPEKSKSYPSQLIGYQEIKDPITGLVTLKAIYSAPVEFEIKKVITTINPTAGIIYRF